MRALAIVALLLGCHGASEQPSRPPVPVAPDPWASKPAQVSDDPPSLVERHKLADEACPTVKAPYF